MPKEQKTVEKTVPKRKPKLLIADLFCGAGGSSTGAMKALSALGCEIVLTCCNHWPIAIETHKKNHPYARHYCQDVATLRPIEAVPEGRLNLLMASPSCTYHSNARGGKPTSDQQRQDPWHIITWLTELRVDCLIIENVPEFQSWGPVSKVTNRTIKSRKGEYFQAWVSTLQGLGFKVEWKVLNAADYGDATTRERFFLIARSDGKPIRWPEPTHFKYPGEDLFGSKKKWRAAREIIDWDVKGKSIFDRKKPLAAKTMARIMAGARKFNWPEPFQVILRNHADGISIDSPVPAITASGKHIAVAEQVLEPFDEWFAATKDLGGTREEYERLKESEPFILNRHGDNGSVRAHSTESPTPAATTRGCGYLVEPEVSPFLLSQVSGGSPRTVKEPVPTIDRAGAISLTEALLVEVNHGENADWPTRIPRSVESPVPGITCKRGVGVAEAILVNMKGRSTATSMDSPAPTITAHAPHLAVAETFVFPVNQGNERLGGHRSVKRPLPTILTRQSFGIAEAMIAPYYGSGSGETCKSVDNPLDTIPTKDRFALIEGEAKPFVVPQFGERDGQLARTHDVDAPLPAVTSHGAGAVVEAAMNSFVVETDQTGSTGACTRSTDAPLYTIVTKQNQALVEPLIELVSDKEGLLKAISQGRLVLIDGKPYLLDIRFRMLMNKELARAMSFEDEETTYEFVGTSTEVTKQIGNAVPVRTACALVHAEFCDMNDRKKEVQKVAA